MFSHITSDTRRCFRYLAFWGNENYFVFIGDHRMHSIYQALIQHIKHGDQTINDIDETSAESQSIINNSDDNNSINGGTSGVGSGNLEYIDYKLKLRIKFIHEEEISNEMIDEFLKYQHNVDPPSAIVVSCTYKRFNTGNITDSLLKLYSRNLTKIVQPLEDLMKKKSKVLWKLQDSVNIERLPDGWKNVTNDYIEKFNQAAIDTLEYSNIHIWSSSKLISNGLLEEMKDGLKLGPMALRHSIQIFLNMYCNDNMNFFDGTCCSSAENYTILQIVTYALLGIW